MSRRIVVCALALVVTGTLLSPSPTQAQANSDSQITGMSWLSVVWNQVLQKLPSLSDIGVQIDGNGIAAQIGIQIDGNGSDIGIQIDGNGRSRPTTNEPGT